LVAGEGRAAQVGGEAFELEVRLDFFDCLVEVLGHVFLDFGDVNDSEKFAFCLENEKIGLLFDVLSVVLEQEVITGLGIHVFNKQNSSVNIIIFKKSLQESTKSILGAILLIIDNSQWKSNFFKRARGNLIFLIGLAPSKDER